MAKQPQAVDTPMAVMAPPLNQEPTLTERIQGLAQELQDIRLDFTLIAALIAEIPDWTVIVDWRYRSPWQLRVNSRTRQVVIAIFYGGACFRANWGIVRYHGPHNVSVPCLLWLRSLHADHISLIRRIYLEYTGAVRFDLVYSRREVARMHERWENEHDRVSAYFGANLAKGALHLPVLTWRTRYPVLEWLNKKEFKEMRATLIS